MLTREVMAGEVIFRQGEAADMAYLIEAGTIEIRHDCDGDARPLALLGPGEVLARANSSLTNWARKALCVRAAVMTT